MQLLNVVMVTFIVVRGVVRAFLKVSVIGGRAVIEVLGLRCSYLF